MRSGGAGSREGEERERFDLPDTGDTFIFINTNKVGETPKEKRK